MTSPFLGSNSCENGLGFQRITVVELGSEFRGADDF